MSFLALLPKIDDAESSGVDHAKAHGVEFEVAIAAKQAAVAAHKSGFVAAFSQETGAMVSVVEMTDLAPGQVESWFAGHWDIACVGYTSVRMVPPLSVGFRRKFVSESAL